jgi:hypothetical protein
LLILGIDFLAFKPATASEHTTRRQSAITHEKV